jgi:hypothetical protein
MAIELVDFPIKNGDFPISYVNVYQRVFSGKTILGMEEIRSCSS